MPSSGMRGDFLAAQFDAAARASMAAVTSRGEDVAIDRERMAAGDARLLRGREQQRIEAAQLLLQQPGRGGFRLALERIAAHQFGQAIRSGAPGWAARAAFRRARRAGRGARPARRLRVPASPPPMM